MAEEWDSVWERMCISGGSTDGLLHFKKSGVGVRIYGMRSVGVIDRVSSNGAHRTRVAIESLVACKTAAWRFFGVVGTVFGVLRASSTEP